MCCVKFHQRCWARVPTYCNKLTPLRRSPSAPDINAIIKEHLCDMHYTHMQQLNKSNSMEDWEISSNAVTFGCKIGSGSSGTVFRGDWFGRSTALQSVA